MRKKITLLFFIMSTLNSFAVNDIKQLEKTIKSFQDQLLVKPLVISDEFILTFEEFSAVAAMQSNEKPDPLQIRREYDRNYIKRIANKIGDFNKTFEILQSIVSYDTLMYHERQNKNEVINFIDVSFVLKYKTHFEPNEEITKRYKFKFVIINNKIKLTGQLFFQSDFTYKSEKMEILQSQEKSDFNFKFKGKIHDKISAECIPKFKNGKWGLVNFKSEQILPCVYDSIYPFANDFSLVVINGEYNLLNTSFRLQLKNNTSKIKYKDGKYLVLNAQKVYVPYPFVDKNSDYAVAPAAAQKQIVKSTIQKEEAPENDIWISNEYNSKKNINNRYVINNNTKDTLAKKSGFLFIDQHGKYLYGIKENAAYLMDIKGNELFKSAYTCNYNSKGNIDIFNSENRLSGMYCPNKKLYIEPKYLVIYPVENENYFVVMTKKKEIGYLDSNGTELF